MSGFASTAWLFWISGGVIALLGFTLLLWALFWDRSKGRRRCPRCWYDLSGTPQSLTCSECGRMTKRERSHFKTRRRWRWAFVALLVFIGAAALALQPKIRRDGLWSIVSNRVLIAGLPLASGLDDFWCRELARRMQLSTIVQTPTFLSGWGTPRMKLDADDWTALFDRCVAGDWRARPVSEDWQAKYGALLRVWIDGSFQVPDPVPKSLEHRLLALPPVVTFKCRETWPLDLPLYVECKIEDWWPYNTPLKGQATPQLPGASEVLIHRHPQALFAPVDFAGESMPINVALEKSPDGAKDTWQVFHQETINVNTKRQGRLTDIMTPVSSPATDQLMASLTYHINRSDGQVRSLGLNAQPTKNALFNDVAIGVVFEFISPNNEVVLTQNHWWTSRGSGGIYWMYDRLTDGLGALNDAKPGENWTIRIRSDPAVAIRVLDCTEYWQGEVTIPLTINER